MTDNIYGPYENTAKEESKPKVDTEEDDGLIVPYFELTDKDLELIEEVCSNKQWHKEPEWIRRRICPVCENILKSHAELLKGIHITCLEKLRKVG